MQHVTIDASVLNILIIHPFRDTDVQFIMLYIMLMFIMLMFGLYCDLSSADMPDGFIMSERLAFFTCNV